MKLLATTADVLLSAYLLPLVLAAGTFAVFFWWLGVSVLWSAAAGLVVLVSAELAFPTRRAPGPHTVALTQREAYVRCDALIAQLTRLESSLTDPEKAEVRAQFVAIRSAAAAVLGALREDAEKQEQVYPFLEYFQYAAAVLQRYAKLSRRNVSSAAKELAATETDWLPRIERQLRSFHEQLHRADVAELAVDGEMLDLMRPLASATPASSLWRGTPRRR